MIFLPRTTIEYLSDSYPERLRYIENPPTRLYVDGNVDILNEIVDQLNIRYSTTDVIKAINFLANNSEHNKNFFKDLKRRYLI